jgi:hypothetical protein
MVLIDPISITRFPYAVNLRVFIAIIKEILIDPVYCLIFKHEKGGLVLR